MTPHRLTISAWAFAAIVFGSAGFAAYKLGNEAIVFSDPRFAGLPLPPSGPVSSTGTIVQEGETVSVGILPSVSESTAEENSRLLNGQIETLQREVVQLRRRLGGLSEQNRAYSKRLSELEAALLQTPDSGRPTDSGKSSPDTAPRSSVKVNAKGPSPSRPIPEKSAPMRAIDLKVEPAKNRPQHALPADQKSLPQPTETGSDSTTTLPADPVPARSPRRIETLPAPETLTSAEPPKSAPAAAGPNASEIVTIRPQPKPDPAFRPVRIVEAVVPEPVSEPEPEIVTGSINPMDGLDDLPAAPEPIRPGSASGKATARGNASINRTDFGVVVGRFPNEAAAADAWLSFKEKNEERMTDLRPVVSPSEQEAGMVNLMAGPFPNAADAAVACLRLLEVSGTCHPALYVGDALKLPQ